MEVAGAGSSKTLDVTPDDEDQKMRKVNTKQVESNKN